MRQVLLRRSILLTAALAGCGAAWADGGLVVREDALSWPRWQGRLNIGAGASSYGLRTNLQNSEAAHDFRVSALSQMSLMGDYYFTGSLVGRGVAGGLRATSGLVVGPRHALLASTALPVRTGSAFSLSRLMGSAVSNPLEGPPDINTVPYLGVGYTGVALKGGFSFSADLGLAAMNAGSGMRLGRVLSGSQGLDDLVRDLQLRPVIQVGVSYSF